MWWHYNTVRLVDHTAGGLSYLWDVEVQGEALSLSFYLPHTQCAGEITGAQALSLQCECAVQGPLRAAPDVVEWDLLKGQRHVALFQIMKLKLIGLCNATFQCCRRTVRFLQHMKYPKVSRFWQPLANFAPDINKLARRILPLGR